MAIWDYYCIICGKAYQYQQLHYGKARTIKFTNGEYDLPGPLLTPCCESGTIQQPITFDIPRLKLGYHRIEGNFSQSVQLCHAINKTPRSIFPCGSGTFGIDVKAARHTRVLRELGLLNKELV